MDESKHEIHSQVDAITAGTASMVNLTAGRNPAPPTVFLFVSKLYIVIYNKTVICQS